MIVQCPRLPVKCPVTSLSFRGSGGGDHCEKLWSGFDSALWGAVWGPLGRHHSGTQQNCGQRDQRRPTLGSTCPILHQATRCVALVTETRLNVIDG